MPPGVRVYRALTLWGGKLREQLTLLKFRKTKKSIQVCEWSSQRSSRFVCDSRAYDDYLEKVREVIANVPTVVNGVTGFAQCPLIE